jgi:hypothetical protein
MQFSIRTIFAIVASVAVLFALWTSIPIQRPLPASIIFVACFVIPAFSLGFDLGRTMAAGFVAVVPGLLVAYLVFIWLNFPVIRE